eukprot:CAMPEP_0173334076 /NCGR_PEP_ID=MMETSP1144-20121109/5239_1 /TAXON_ID=483371 /ORGANISM="non described non described, Strain CCMP2298" /LENGTH=146 /DNA_ID=CAMNT_0014279095 /DNA_START=62 /DNA_END=502 /DNA_ORIENTATION=-
MYLLNTRIPNTAPDRNRLYVQLQANWDLQTGTCKHPSPSTGTLVLVAVDVEAGGQELEAFPLVVLVRRAQGQVCFFTPPSPGVSGISEWKDCTDLRYLLKGGAPEAVADGVGEVDWERGELKLGVRWKLGTDLRTPDPDPGVGEVD